MKNPPISLEAQKIYDAVEMQKKIALEKDVPFLVYNFLSHHIKDPFQDSPQFFRPRRRSIFQDQEPVRKINGVKTHIFDFTLYMKKYRLLEYNGLENPYKGLPGWHEQLFCESQEVFSASFLLNGRLEIIESFIDGDWVSDIAKIKQDIDIAKKAAIEGINAAENPKRLDELKKKFGIK